MIEALRGANSAVLEASQDSALVYARMLDVAAQKYSTPDHPITARDLAARIQIGGRAQGYGQYMSPEEKLAWDEKEWAKTLNDIENWNGPTRPVRVMHTPLIMQMIGAKNLPVYMDVSKIKRIEKEHPDMTREVLQQIPRALTDPIIMFSSRTRPGRMVAVLELKAKNGANVVVPFVLDVEKNWVQANVIASAYPKGDQGTNFRWMQEQVRNGNLLYADRNRAEDVLGTDREKAIDLLVSAGVQFPMEPKGNDGISKRKIPDESDLVKYKNARLSYYQMDGERAETAPLAKLEEAKAMQTSGEGENAIWKKTGWMIGKDGKWRWEIPDNLEGIHMEPLKNEEHSLFGPEWKTAYLGEIYDNQKLYEAYPWMKYLEVSSGDIGQETYYGYTEMGRRAHLDRITLNANIMDDETQVKKTLIHEIQHVIQHYEGFAQGGSPESVIDLIKRERNLVLDSLHANAEIADYAAAVENGEENYLKKVGEKLSEKERKKVRRNVTRLHELNAQEEEAMRNGTYEAYRNLAGEQEARATAYRAERMNNAEKAEREGKKKVLEARRQLEETVKDLEGKDKKHLLALADARMGYLERNERPKDDVLNWMDDAEEWIREKAPDTVRDAYDAFDDALWDYGTALDDKQIELKMWPMIHGDNAIVIFGGESMPYSVDGGMTYYQKAWHGSGARFDRFDLGYLFSG